MDLKDLLNPIGSVVGGLVSGIGNIIGGNQQASAQRAANRTNLQIAQETNAQQMDMFKQQLQFNSFENQRKMLEQAGYSPYSLFGTSSVAAPTSPSLHIPQIIPEDAKGIMFQNLGTSIGNNMSNLANIAATFASANKMNAEAKRQQIENDVLPELLEIQRQGGISDVVWKSLQNKLMKHQFDALAIQPDIQNQFTIGQTKLNAQQMALLAIQTSFQEEYGGRLNEAEIEKKCAEAFASWQKGWLDNGELAHIDDKYKAILDTAASAQRQADAAERQAGAAERNAATNEKRMQAQNAADYANAKKLQADTYRVKLENWLVKEYGPTKAAYEANQAVALFEKIVAEGQYTRADIDRVKRLFPVLEQTAQKLENDNKYREAQEIREWINTAAKVASSASDYGY